MRTLSSAILAAVLGLAATFAAQGAGLGRLTVLSPLGSPLNAEIELVSLQPGEEDNLNARIAPLEAFQQAGIEPSAALLSVRLAVVRRNGKPVIRVTSSQPMNEPFVDLLIELEWNGGRLVREYTLLLDPPEFKGPQTIAAVPAPAPAPARPAEPSAQVLPPPEVLPPLVESKAESAGVTPSEPAVAEKPVAEKPRLESMPLGGTYEVKRGDTLGEIARAHLPPGVNLSQMLIALYRANPDAFLRENINLVRAGRVLNLPTAQEVSAVDLQDANRLVQSHRAEWDEYRSRLAAQPVTAESASGQRAVAGKIEAKPEAPVPAGRQDQVRLAKADPAKPGAAARGDDVAAQERALKEAQSRVADLEKNVADLQKLVEIRNQQLAELQKKTAAKPEAVKPEAVKPEAAKPEPAQPAPAPAPAPEAKKAEPAKPKPKAAPPPPPPPAPSLLDELLENQIALAGLGAIVVLLLGYALWSRRRKKATQAKFSDSVLGAGAAAGPATEGGPAAAAADSQASVSQSSGMEAEEVDPIAEADVYMAYGRDSQAEEILKEALQKDPSRIPVHSKLLEIYAKRNDVQAFEQTALKLKNLTHGTGAEWEKAAALGRSIDAGNGLYGGGVAPAAETMAVVGGAGAAAVAAAGGGSIDFDIGGATSSGMVTTDIPLDVQAPLATSSTIDFDLGATSARVKDTSQFAAPNPLDLDRPDLEATVTNLDFDLNAGPSEKKPPAGDSNGIDFDLNLDLGEKPAEAEKSVPPMDLSAISLDLGSPGEGAGAAPSNDPKWQEVATKLDLAKAYEEMGDKDGARELLSEVMKDGDAAQKGQAQQLLTRLG